MIHVKPSFFVAGILTFIALEFAWAVWLSNRQMK